MADVCVSHLLMQVKTLLGQTLEENVNPHRPSLRRGSSDGGTPLAVKQACKLCKQKKAMCFGSPGTDCPRCQRAGVPCEYPQRGRPGRRANNAHTNTLREAEAKIQDALNIVCASQYRSKLHEVASSDSSGQTPAGSAARSSSQGSWAANTIAWVLENPMEMLENVDRRNDPSDSAEEFFLWQYFSTGMYQSISDANAALDPVHLGVLTDGDFDRLVALYFKELRPSLWLLTPDLHTPSYIRDVSPFLATAVAATAAQFCPISGHLITPLAAHIRLLSVRMVMEGYKSAEICQAYLILAHWLSPPELSSKDQTWAFVSQASRIAKELRLDRPLDQSIINEYARLTTLPPNVAHLLSEDRLQTRRALFGVELSLSVLTGRTAAIPGSSHLKTLPSLPDVVDPADPGYLMHANDRLNRIFAKALNLAAGLQDEGASQDQDLRNAFNASWLSDFELWTAMWPGLSKLILLRFTSLSLSSIIWIFFSAYPTQVHHLNVRLILLSVSLHFSGPMDPILEECKSVACQTVRLVNEWIAQDQSILYSSNLVIVDIAYATVLLLKFMIHHDHYGNDPVSWKKCKDSCSRVGDALERIGKARIHSTSLASLQAARIRMLLQRLTVVPSEDTSATVLHDTSLVTVTEGYDADLAATDFFLGWFTDEQTLLFG